MDIGVYFSMIGVWEDKRGIGKYIHILSSIVMEDYYIFFYRKSFPLKDEEHVNH